ncbi:hypothetical protein FRZ00_05750 [Streptomyces mobaraensis]|uniref:Uncharacterized protein n=1 Tax=Streptomyces mobaraensis TaxID=35621 RepID=A0A5N5WED5_STRMB|nr:hypothetical protein FRZ00_05750 [Streptomyces mobaraensis]
MHQPQPPDRLRLSPTQSTRLTMASQDLADARAADLASLDVPGLILLVERLRGSLDDALRLIKELAPPP